jgi:hypothetical protein
MALDLRPLTLAELLDRSFSTYKRHLWLFVGIMAVPAVVATLYAVAMQAFSGAIRPDMPPEQVLLIFIPMMIGAFVFMIALIVVHTFAFGVRTRGANQFHGGLVFPLDAGTRGELWIVSIGYQRAMQMY